jgi:hypothetical protein
LFAFSDLLHLSYFSHFSHHIHFFMSAPIFIHNDPVFGLYAHTTAEQTAVIDRAFDEESGDINPDAAKRLKRDGFDLILFSYKSINALRDDAIYTGLNFQSAPPPAAVGSTAAGSTTTVGSAAAGSADAAPEFHYPPHLVRLITLGEEKRHGEQRLSEKDRPGDYYRKLGITPSDIPAPMRMYHDPEIIYMQNHGNRLPAVWARFHVLRALVELRAPGIAQILLDNLRNSDDDDEIAIEDSIDLIPKLDEDQCSLAIAALRDNVNAGDSSGDYDRFSNTLPEMAEKIVDYHPNLRAACLDAVRKQLENHPVNDHLYNGFLVSALIHCEAVESIALIEQAYTAGNVDLTICGDLEDVQLSLGLREKRDTPRPHYFAKFRRALRRADGCDDEDDDDDAGSFNHAPFHLAAPKIGRNDPCPCGSGKKYKKCCMDKDMEAERLET